MMDVIVSFLQSDVRIAIPILLAALGLIFNARAGVVNIGGEGIMLIGAVSAAAGSFYTGSAWFGLLFSGLAGMLFALLFGFMVITARAHQTVSGTAMNILGLGVSTVVSRVIFGAEGGGQKVASFNAIHIPGLSKIPIIGPILFQQNALTYLAIIMIVVCHFVMFKTELGLRIRAVGEHPRACDTVGINVNRIKYSTVIFGGFMCGLAGASVSLGHMSFFQEDMIAGRGFIALAVVTFGKWKPTSVLFAALLFGAGEALQFRLQALDTGIPYQFAAMIPYVLTLLALVGIVGKTQAPAASGAPYVKE